MAAKRILAVLSPSADASGTLSLAQRLAFEGADEVVFRPGPDEAEGAWLVQVSRWRHRLDLAVGVQVDACQQALELGMDRVFLSTMSKAGEGLASRFGPARIGVYVAERHLGAVEVLLEGLRRAGAGEVVAPSGAWRGAAPVGLESAGMAWHAPRCGSGPGWPPGCDGIPPGWVGCGLGAGRGIPLVRQLPAFPTGAVGTGGPSQGMRDRRTDACRMGGPIRHASGRSSGSRRSGRRVCGAMPQGAFRMPPACRRTWPCSGSGGG